MSVIYDIDFETGDFSEFDTDNSGAQLTVSASNPINGSFSALHQWASGIQNVNNSTSIAATDFLRCGFKIRLNSLSFGTLQTTATIFNHNNGSTLYGFRLDKSGSEVRPALTGLVTLTTTVDINDGAIHTLEARIVKESSMGAGDGIHAIYIDGLLAAEDTAVANTTLFDDARVGIQNWLINQLRILSGTGHSGSITTDDWILRDDDTPIYPGGIADDQFAPALMPKPAAINMDGSFIYIGALASDGTPILIKFATALNADGSIVFQPGAGDNIGVEVGKKDADIVWVAGNFGGTDTVEKSEDAGQTWNVRDPGSFDPVVAFNVSPESDEHVLIATNLGASAASGTLQVTFDDGNSWQEINSNTASTVRDIEQLDINPQEVVLGGETPEEIDYSVNYGQDLEDYSAGFPATDVNKVIVG